VGKGITARNVEVSGKNRNPRASVISIMSPPGKWSDRTMRTSLMAFPRPSFSGPVKGWGLKRCWQQRCGGSRSVRHRAALDDGSGTAFQGWPLGGGLGEIDQSGKQRGAGKLPDHRPDDQSCWPVVTLSVDLVVCMLDAVAVGVGHQRPQPIHSPTGGRRKLVKPSGVKRPPRVVTATGPAKGTPGHILIRNEGWLIAISRAPTLLTWFQHW